MDLSNKSVEVRLVDPGTATRWLNECAFPNQRAIRLNWVSELARRLQDGQWEGGMIKFHQVDDRWLQVDGHHRLCAIVEAGIPGWVVIEWTHDSTIDEARAAYNRTDGGIPRTVGERMKASGTCEETGLTQSQISRTLCAARFINNGYKESASAINERSIDEKKQLVAEWADEARFYFSLAKGSRHALTVPMMASGPLAVAFTILRHRPEEATAFLTELFENSGLVAGNPIHTLMQSLISPDNKRKSQSYRARAVAFCWNSYFRKEKLYRLRFSEVGDLRIAGSNVRPKPLKRAA